jgi:putative membrane protein
MNKILALQPSIWKTQLSVFAIWLVTISGMIGIWLGQGDWFLPKTPMNLLLGAGLLLWNFPAKNGWRSLGIWSLAFGIGFFVEVLGVSTGFPFGEYQYGENLGPKFLGVPFLIGLNWVVLTFLTLYVGKRLSKNKWLACLTGATLMVSLDVFIEPVAPIFDFVAWFVVAFGLQVLSFSEVPETKTGFPLHHFAAQLIFFGFFYAFYQY